MNLFLDTEFTRLPWLDGSELISIGIVLENGEEYYGCSSESNLDNSSEFVRNHVLEGLPSMANRETLVEIGCGIDDLITGKDITSVWAVFPTLEQLSCLYTGAQSVEVIHTQYADWDFQLFKNLASQSAQMPIFCNDLSEIVRQLDQSVLPINSHAHNALEDARWNHEVWKAWSHT